TGLLGSLVKGIAIAPTTPTLLFVAAADTVYASSDSAGSWQPANGGLAGAGWHSVRAAASDPKILYVTNDRTVFRSGDRGATWTSIQAAPIAIPFDLAVHPTDARIP